MLVIVRFHNVYFDPLLFARSFSTSLCPPLTFLHYYLTSSCVTFLHTSCFLITFYSCPLGPCGLFLCMILFSLNFCCYQLSEPLHGSQLTPRGYLLAWFEKSFRAMPIDQLQIGSSWQVGILRVVDSRSTGHGCLRLTPVHRAVIG
jgi:hypothetical protein